MFRKLLTSISRHPWVRKIAMSTPILRNMAWHFVAGESQEEGLQAVKDLNGKGIKATLNFIGTHVRNEREAVAATQTATRTRPTSRCGPMGRKQPIWWPFRVVG